MIFVSDDFLVAGLSEKYKPIIVLRYLDAELLGVRESDARLPTVIGKYQKNKTVYPGNDGNPSSRKRKFDDFAMTVGNQANKGRTCLERLALRSPMELVTLIKRLIELVAELKDKGTKVILVCPMPRHFTPCCGDEAHFGKKFPHEDYLKTVFELSTFLQVLPEMRDVVVLHPGEVVGWGRPSEKRVVHEDGLHLKEPHKTKIHNTILAVIRSIRSGLSGPLDRMTCAAFSPETYPEFVRVTRAKGRSFQCPQKQ